MDTGPDRIPEAAASVEGFLVSEEPTTAAVQRYLNALAGDAPAEPIVREFLRRAVTIQAGLAHYEVRVAPPRDAGPAGVRVPRLGPPDGEKGGDRPTVPAVRRVIQRVLWLWAGWCPVCRRPAVLCGDDESEAADTS